MESLVIDNLTLYFPAQERAAAELIRQACERSIPLIRDSWGLGTPKDLRVYVLEQAWLRAIFHAAPWRWRPLMVVSMPVWYPRGRRLWRIAGGWQQQFGRRRAVCVKPPRLLISGDGKVGDLLFIREDCRDARVQQITCHELTHAFTAQLKLPAWLNEGLAMVTAERYAGKPMVRRESLALLEVPPDTRGSVSGHATKASGMEAVVAGYARGYWRTRYLEETQPGLLRDLFTQTHRPNNWEDAIAVACSASRDVFWPEIDKTLLADFGQQIRKPETSAAIPL